MDYEEESEEDDNCLICLEKVDASDTDTAKCRNTHQGVGIAAAGGDISAGSVCCKALYHVDCILCWLADESRSCSQCRRKLRSVRCTNENKDIDLPPVAEGHRHRHQHAEDLADSVATEAATLTRLAVMFHDLRGQLPAESHYKEPGILLMYIFCNHGISNSFLMEQLSSLQLFTLAWPVGPQPLIGTQDVDHNKFQCSAIRWCMNARLAYPKYTNASFFSFYAEMFSRLVFPALKFIVKYVLSAECAQDENSAYVLLLLLSRELLSQSRVTHRGGTGILTPECDVSLNQLHVLLAYTIELCNKAANTTFCLSAKETAYVKQSLGDLHWLLSRGILCAGAHRTKPTETWTLTVWHSQEDAKVIPDNSAFSLVYKIMEEEEEEEEKEEEEEEPSFFMEAAVPVNRSCAFACASFQPHLFQGVHHLEPVSTIPSDCRTGKILCDSHAIRVSLLITNTCVRCR